ncbi:MAG: hypothetical protein JWO15_3515 [Sphingomonadales bacterium]|nr:hypothetical protein [Sphingomonadales bacterium]
MSLSVTYETSVNEALHPDASVRARLVEVALSDCPHGCKIYADPRSALRVLAHNAVYGCRR